jgi:hypothetical protein
MQFTVVTERRCYSRAIDKDIMLDYQSMERKSLGGNAYDSLFCITVPYAKNIQKECIDN